MPELPNGDPRAVDLRFSPTAGLLGFVAVIVLAAPGARAGTAAKSFTDHFAKGMQAMRPALAHTPKIISRQVSGDDWDPMGELAID